MKAEFKYKIIPSMKLIVDCFYGDVYFDSYMAYKSKQVNDPEYDSSYDVLLDLRDSNLRFTTAEIDQGVKRLLQNRQFIATKKIAQLTHTPNQVVISTLVNMKDSPIKSVVFSTLDRAVWFLGHSGDDKIEIIETLSGIRSAVKRA